MYIKYENKVILWVRKIYLFNIAYLQLEKKNVPLCERRIEKNIENYLDIKLTCWQLYFYCEFQPENVAIT